MDLKRVWKYAMSYCTSMGMTKENIEWWHNLPTPDKISDVYFLSELAWCVYNAGMKEKVVRSKWPSIEATYAFFNIDYIVQNETDILSMIKPVFNHLGKAKAVIEAAKMIKRDGPLCGKFSVMSDNEILQYLTGFPYIGEVTKYHLARNIGLDVVKPDRHMVRLTQYLGYDSPDKLVGELSILTGEKKGFIDYILWQWLSWHGSVAYDALDLMQ